MLLGFLAVDESGGWQPMMLTKTTFPRKQLLEHFQTKHARKMYCDVKNGESKHIGYIVRGQWFRIYEVHDWKGKE